MKLSTKVKDPRSIKRFLSLENEFNKIHHNRYDYSKFEYYKGSIPSTIICSVHGEFKLSAGKHLQGRGCQKCGYEETGNKLKYNSNLLIDDFKDIHKNKYSYTKTIYKGANEKIIVTCPIHGDFEIRAQHHKNGVGCKSCAEYGFNPSKPAIFYVLKLNGNLFKIGITNRSVKDRYSQTDYENIEILNKQYFENGADALNLENEYKDKLREFRYKGPKVLESASTTEIYTVNPILDIP